MSLSSSEEGVDHDSAENSHALAVLAEASQVLFSTLQASSYI